MSRQLQKRSRGRRKEPVKDTPFIKRAVSIIFLLFWHLWASEPAACRRGPPYKRKALHHLKREGGVMEEKGKAIIFVSDYWGSEKGGVNVVNFELCSAMGYIVTGNTKVAGLVIGKANEGCTDRQIMEAEENNVVLIRYIRENNEKLEYQLVLRRVLDSLKGKFHKGGELVWVGHDIHTGDIALGLSRACRARGIESQFSLIIHTLYGQTEQYKANGDREGKLDKQVFLLGKADKIFCIGPILKPRLEKGYHISTEITELIPGLTKFDERNRRELHVLTYGSVVDDTNRQKDWEAVCWGLAGALKGLGGNYSEEFNSIKVYGFRRDIPQGALKRKERDLEQRILEETGVRLNVELKYFETDRGALYKRLQESQLFVLNSEFESFSLAAWEAISAGVPVVITRTSGVYQYLEKRFGYLTNGLCGIIDGGKALLGGMGNAKDPEQVRVDSLSKVIANVIENLSKMEYATRFLQNNLQDCTWGKMAMEMANALGIRCGTEFTVQGKDNFYENTYSKRETVFSIFENRVERCEISNYIVFFGGISSRLISDSFIQSLLKLLCSKNGLDVHIYYCYEAEEAILQREEMRAIEGGNDEDEEKRKEARKKSRERVKMKAARIAGIKEIYSEKYNELDRDSFSILPGLDQVLDRIHIIALNKSPIFYFNFIDDNVYLGFKYETRSSINTTIEVNTRTSGLQERIRILNHMAFILDDSEKDDDYYKMQELVRRLKDEYTGKIRVCNDTEGG